MPLIPLRDRAGLVIAHAEVDDADYATLAAHRWAPDRSRGGALRNVKRPDGRWIPVRMHRAILPDAPGLIRHRNGNRLDNRRANLEILDGAREPTFRGDTCRIPLGGKGGAIRAWTLIDPDDWPRVARFRWYLAATGYVFAHKTGTWGDKVRLHRLITDAPSGREVDHINGDPLDNRKANLRIVTHAQNAQNVSADRDSRTSQHRGVYWHAGKWEARVGRKYLGRFSGEDDAARVAAEFRAEHMPFSRI